MQSGKDQHARQNRDKEQCRCKDDQWANNRLTKPGSDVAAQRALADFIAQGDQSALGWRAATIASRATTPGR